MPVPNKQPVHPVDVASTSTLEYTVPGTSEHAVPKVMGTPSTLECGMSKYMVTPSTVGDQSIVIPV